jgi:hypothetical protein
MCAGDRLQRVLAREETMKEATLYRVTQDSIVTSRDYIDIVRHTAPPVFHLGDGDFGMFTDYKMTADCVPLEQIVRCGQRSWIAIDPELRQLIEQRVVSEYTKLLDASEHERKTLRHERNNIISSVRSFVQLPWYKRVWAALSRKYCYGMMEY